MNIKRIIKESINDYIHHIINEDNDFNYVDSEPIQEFIDWIESYDNDIKLNVGESDFEFSTENYFFQVSYNLVDNGYMETYQSNDYDLPDEQESFSDLHFERLDITYSNGYEDDEMIPLEIDDEIEKIILDNCSIDDDYELPLGQDDF